MRARSALAAATLLTLTLTGCGSTSDEPAAPRAASSSPVAEALLADFDLAGLDAVQIVDRLDRLGGNDRPADLVASVRPDELMLTATDADGTERELSLPIPSDRFYLSVAPYVAQTHECFYHSLTTCKGELGGEQIVVQIVDEASGEVLVDGSQTVFDNGFVGFWLPRGIEGTLRISHDGAQGETSFGTGEDDPTCLTTVQLA